MDTRRKGPQVALPIMAYRCILFTAFRIATGGHLCRPPMTAARLAAGRINLICVKEELG
jgi:hypothetical protein